MNATGADIGLLGSGDTRPFRWPFTRTSKTVAGMIDKGRIAEGVTIALLAGVIAAAAATWTTGQVLSTRMDTQEKQLNELRQELRELRRDIYRPAYPGTGPRGTTIMPTVAVTDLITDLKASLHSSASFFPGTDADADADYRRHLDIAQRALATDRPRIRIGEITLQAGIGDYSTLPVDLLEVRSPLWGASKGIKPWDPGHPGPMPRLSLQDSATGQRLSIQPAPTADQISVLGATFRYYYAANLQVDADNLSLTGDQRELLLLRAQAEAMSELAILNANRPGQTRTNLAQSSNAQPGAIGAALMQRYLQRVGRAA